MRAEGEGKNWLWWPHYAQRSLGTAPGEYENNLSTSVSALRGTGSVSQEFRIQISQRKIYF